MGTKRVEGKKKKKSIKAKVTSKFSAKRKLSRNGKVLKKGMMGPSTDFLTRSAVLKKLQVTLKDFRRLCILKGIYPRVPPKAPSKGSDKIYYDIKDISYLAHEPLLHKFREFKAFMKKIRKASGRRQYDEARRKDRLKPVMLLDHLVRERYPRFIDALRDLDDALCMIHLFASLPSIGRVTSEKTNQCIALTQQWQFICMKSKTLRKVFVSVKGVYYQVEIMGEAITWIVPHQFTQVIPPDIDIRVMMTFLEFYDIFLKFVLFKLYHSEGLQYPPIVDKQLYDNGCGILSLKIAPLNGNGAATLLFATDSVLALTPSIDALEENNDAADNLRSNKSEKLAPRVLESLNKKLHELESRVNDDVPKNLQEGSIDKANEFDDGHDDEDNEAGQLVGPLSEVFATMHGTASEGGPEGSDDKNFFESALPTDETTHHVNLFKKFKFFVNREVPLNCMQFCILSFGGLIGWDSELSPYSSDDESITHHIIDRPLATSVSYFQSREYIQPQWIFDCINMKTILPTFHYKPGAHLPPHLSPFVDDEKEGYIPKYKQEILKLKSSASSLHTVSAHTGNQKQKTFEEDDDDDAEYKPEPSDKPSNHNEVGNNDTNNDGYDDDEYLEEVYKEVRSAKGAGAVKGPKAVVFTPTAAKEHVTEDLEANDLAKVMMSKKTKRLYQRMQHGLSIKKQRISALKEKSDALSTASEDPEVAIGRGDKSNGIRRTRANFE